MVRASSMHLSLLTSVYAIIFLAELPDKTALASLFLATRHRPLPVFLGASLALTIQSVVAVAFGHLQVEPGEGRTQRTERVVGRGPLTKPRMEADRSLDLPRL